MNKNKKRDFTVVLLRPEGVSDTYAIDTYIACVQAPDVTAAIRQARASAKRTDEYAGPGVDYFTIAVFRGRRTDINNER